MNVEDTTRRGLRLTTAKQAHTVPGYEWLSERMCRHLIFHSQKRVNSRGEIIPDNGLEEFGAIRRVGRRVLLDLDALDAAIVSGHLGKQG